MPWNVWSITQNCQQRQMKVFKLGVSPNIICNFYVKLFNAEKRESLGWTKETKGLGM